MRWLGIGLLTSVFPGVLFPEPINWYLLVFLLVTGAVSFAAHVADKGAQITHVVQSNETKQHLAWIRRIKKLTADEETAWDKWLGDSPHEGRPICGTPRPEHLRIVDASRLHLLKQRRPTNFS